MTHFPGSKNRVYAIPFACGEFEQPNCYWLSFIEILGLKENVRNVLAGYPAYTYTHLAINIHIHTWEIIYGMSEIIFVIYQCVSLFIYLLNDFYFIKSFIYLFIYKYFISLISLYIDRNEEIITQDLYLSKIETERDVLQIFYSIFIMWLSDIFVVTTFRSYRPFHVSFFYRK